jgi:hypothetical protein
MGKEFKFYEAINPLFCPYCGEDISNRELEQNSGHCVSREENTFKIYCPKKRKQAEISP